MAPLLRRVEKVRRQVEHGQLHGKAAIGLRVGRVINEYKVAKHIVLDIRDDRFDFSVSEDNVAAEAALDGIYVVRTSLPKERMDAGEAVRDYKALTRVERAFRTRTPTHIHARPLRPPACSSSGTTASRPEKLASQRADRFHDYRDHGRRAKTEVSRLRIGGFRVSA